MLKTITKSRAFCAFLKGGLFFSFLTFSSAVFGQNPFWSEDFSTPPGTEWANEDLSGNNALWEHCDNPFLCAPIAIPVDFLEEPRFMSTTALNGYMVVNSNAVSPEAHLSVLRSPKIDCSSVTERVILRFETHIAVRESPPNETAILRVRSESSGWVEFKFFENLSVLPMGFGNNESCNAEIIHLDITTLVAGQSEVELEWRWEAEKDLSWAIDDIALFDYHPLEKDVVWGTQSGEGDFSGGFNNWETKTIFGTCDWYWDPVGWAGNSYFNSVPNDLKICSQTGNNGAAVIHPDSCSGGNPSMISPVVAELISPTIDLSGVSGEAGLILEFDQLFAEGNPFDSDFPITRVMISTDNGETWFNSKDCNPEVCFWVTNFENSTFRTALPPEVLESSEFKIKFVFSGRFVFLGY